MQNPFLQESRIRCHLGRCLRKLSSKVSSLEAMLYVGLLLSFSIGCVQRRMTIRSNPPGALVYVDDYQVGTTPVSTDFVYYGTRKIRLIKDGYDTLTVQQPFPVPWYEIFPLDFVTENLWPWEIRDERVVDLAMVPMGTVPVETVVSRAELARRSAGSGPPVPVAPVAVPPRSLPPGASTASPNVLPQAPVEPLPLPSTGPVFPTPQ
ncbi:PEGA domain-containing protein [Pirellulales bacterium]|nr:PEGA domain-containing protein [Pirellulales bacterium]